MALWSRIKHDLKGYMVEKETDDTRVIFWYHRRFIEVANSFYIGKLGKEREAIFANVVDFFNETWKHKPKPYRYNKYVAKKKNLKSDEAQEIRDTSTQPTSFVDSKGNLKFNKRKIIELPRFILQLTPNLAVPLSCENIFFNYQFLTGMFYCCSYDEIMSNLKQLTEKSTTYKINDETNEALIELKMMSYIFLKCSLSLTHTPSSAVSQILAHSLQFYSKSKYFRKLIDQHDKESLPNCALIVPYQHKEKYDAQSSNLLFQLNAHKMPITHASIGLHDNNRHFFTLSEQKFHLFDLEVLKDCGEVELDIFGKQPTNLLVYMNIHQQSQDIHGI